MENTDNNLDIKFTFQCKQKWYKLQPTANPDVRFCHDCSLNVHSIVDRLDLEKLDIGEKCIALTTELSEREGWVTILGGVERSTRSLPKYPPQQQFIFSCGYMANLTKSQLNTLHFLRRDLQVTLSLKKKTQFTAWCAQPEELDRIIRVLEREEIIYSIE
jgi:hypothetical protein